MEGRSYSLVQPLSSILYPSILYSRILSNSLLLQSRPRQSRLVHAEMVELAMFDFADVNGSPVSSAEADVAGLGAGQLDFLHDLPLRRKLDHRPLAIPGDVQISVDVAALAVVAEI